MKTTTNAKKLKARLPHEEWALDRIKDDKAELLLAAHWELFREIIRNTKASKFKKSGIAYTKPYLALSDRDKKLLWPKGFDETKSLLEKGVGLFEYIPADLEEDFPFRLRFFIEEYLPSSPHAFVIDWSKPITTIRKNFNKWLKAHYSGYKTQLEERNLAYHQLEARTSKMSEEEKKKDAMYQDWIVRRNLESLSLRSNNRGNRNPSLSRLANLAVYRLHHLKGHTRPECEALLPWVKIKKTAFFEKHFNDAIIETNKQMLNLADSLLTWSSRRDILRDVLFSDDKELVKILKSQKDKIQSRLETLRRKTSGRPKKFETNISE